MFEDEYPFGENELLVDAKRGIEDAKKTPEVKPRNQLKKKMKSIFQVLVDHLDCPLFQLVKGDGKITPKEPFMNIMQNPNIICMINKNKAVQIPLIERGSYY